MTKLKRTLGLGECIFFGVGSILGAGIYTLIGEVAGLSGNMIAVSFLVASMAAVLTAFSYAELSAALPRSGGEYVYAKKAFGPKTGIILGVIISLNGIISGAAVSVGFAGYLSQLTGLSVIIGATLIITLLFLVNVSGIRQSSTMNIIFTIIESAGLLIIIYASLSSFGKVDYFEMPPEGINGVLAGASLAFFAYIGFEEIVKLAEETKQPEKNIPKALFFASFIVLVMYCIVAAGAVSVLDYEALARSKGPLATIAESRFGKTGLILISVIALFATANTILSNMLGSSRVLLRMADHSGLLKLFSFVSPKSKTPVAALVLILILMAILAQIGDIGIIARIATIFIFVAFIIVNLAVITLRIREPSMKRPFRIPGNIGNVPVISIAGILLTALLLVYTVKSLVKDIAASTVPA
jgi:APA family basic amino acid/polyamine antiporter